MLYKKTLLIVSFICLTFHYVKAVDIVCHVNADNQCVFEQDITLNEKEPITITNSDKLVESTTNIVIKAPFKTKFIPAVIFDKFINLKSLTIKEVGLTGISNENFVNAKKLENLHIEGNNLEILKANTFSTLKHLKMLDLSENQIKKIEDGVFDSLVDLNKLVLHGNKVVNLDLTQFTKLPKLDYLIVSYMDFTFSGPFIADDVAKIVALNSSITKLDLSNNPIDNTDLWRRLSIFPNLETAYFTATKITHVDYMEEFKKLLPHVSRLIMDENPFESKWLEEAKAFFSKEDVSFTYI